MKKILIGIFTIAVLIVAAKFGLEYQYKKKLDQLVQLAAPFVQISYDDIKIDLKGGINVANINANRTNETEKIFIQNIRVFSSNRLFLLKGFDILSNNEFPNTFAIDLNKVEFDARLGQEFNDKKECQFIEEPINLANFTRAILTNNVNLSITKEDADFLKATFRINTNGVSSTNADIVFNKSLIKTKQLSTQEIPFESATVETSFNEVYANKAIDYCAKKLEISSQEFLTNVIGSDSFYSALKLVPSPRLKRAYQGYVAGKSNLSLTINPSPSTRNLSQLSLFTPEQIINKLNLEIEENGEKITSLIGEPSPTSHDTKEIIPDQEASNASGSTAKTPKKHYGKLRFSFEEVNNSELRNHIGRTARIYRKKRLIEGEILSVKGNIIQINNKRFGGSTLMSFPLAEISEVKVKIFKKPN